MGIKEGNAKVVMSAYNKLNNIFCSSHQELLIKILKEEWSLMVMLLAIGVLHWKQ